MRLSLLGGVFLVLGAFVGESRGGDPNTALAGVYTECVFKMDWPCLQKKTLMFVDRLGREPEFQLLPGVRLVRTSEAVRPPVEETPLPLGDSERMGQLVDQAVVQFFDEHVVRLHVPVWLRDTGRSLDDHVDLFFGEREGENSGLGVISGDLGVQNGDDAGPKGEQNDENELDARRGRMLCGGGGGKKCKGMKKGAKKAKKGLKKCLMAVCMVLAGKMMLLAPMMMGMMKIASIKALILSLISILMSKGMMMKGKGKGKGMMQMMMQGWQGGGGGGGGWDAPEEEESGGGWQPSGGGGGGPYRRSVRAHAQNLAYNNYSATNL